MQKTQTAKSKTAAASAKKPTAVAAKTANKGNDTIRRRDASGDLDPRYAADLRALGKEGRVDDGNPDGFLDGARSGDDLAEELGEHFVRTAVSGEDDADDDEDEMEEHGGPFVVTSAKTELATGTDASNPKDATREPFPTT